MRENQRRHLAERLQRIRQVAAEETAKVLSEKRPIVNRQRLEVTSIKSGKVLAEGIHSEDGNLPLAAGTALTKSFPRRLGELADNSAVDVQLLVGDFKG